MIAPENRSWSWKRSAPIVGPVSSPTSSDAEGGGFGRLRSGSIGKPARPSGVEPGLRNPRTRTTVARPGVAPRRWMTTMDDDGEDAGREITNLVVVDPPFGGDVRPCVERAQLLVSAPHPFATTEKSRTREGRPRTETAQSKAERGGATRLRAEGWGSEHNRHQTKTCEHMENGKHARSRTSGRPPLLPFPEGPCPAVAGACFRSTTCRGFAGRILLACFRRRRLSR